jgi:hypothetical protein
MVPGITLETCRSAQTSATRREADLADDGRGWKAGVEGATLTDVARVSGADDMRIGQAVLIASLGFAANAAAEPSAWRVDGAPNSTPYRLAFTDKNGGESYEFECRSDGVLVKETGVTKLTDVHTGKLIGDEPGSSITSGAAFLMLVTNPKLKSDFSPASATPNSVRGWDLSMLLPKNDKQWRAFPRAKAVSLMSTGFTTLVELDDETRRLIAQFVEGCGS